MLGKKGFKLRSHNLLVANLYPSLDILTLHRQTNPFNKLEFFFGSSSGHANKILEIFLEESLYIKCNITTENLVTSQLSL